MLIVLPTNTHSHSLTLTHVHSHSLTHTYTHSHTLTLTHVQPGTGFHFVFNPPPGFISMRVGLYLYTYT